MKMVDQSLLSTQVSQNKVCSSGLTRLVWQQVTFTFLLTSHNFDRFTIQNICQRLRDLQTELILIIYNL